MNPSRNLFLIGATGAGKTSIGRRLATHYGCPFVDLDQEIEQHAGVSTSTIFDVEGETAFRERESMLLDNCTQRSGIILASGAGAVLRSSNRERLAARGFVVWLQTTLEQQLERLRHDRSRPLLDVADRRLRLQAMAAQREPLYRAIADLVIASDGDSLPVISARCIDLIDAQWTQPGASMAQRHA